MPTYTFTVTYKVRVGGRWHKRVESDMRFEDMAAFVRARMLDNPRYKLLDIGVVRWERPPVASVVPIFIVAALIGAGLAI